MPVEGGIHRISSVALLRQLPRHPALQESRHACWDALCYADQRAAMTTPTLHVGRWFDLFITGTVDNYVTLTDRAATAHARRNQRLVVGPWTHADQTGTAGELFFGRSADATAIGLERQQLEFLRRVVAGDDAPTDRGCGSSSWVTTSGAMRRRGRSLAPDTRRGTCTPAGGCHPKSRHPPRDLRHTPTIRATPCRPSVDRR
jgi:hypothetical protein